jgi:hypothetical protein
MNNWRTILAWTAEPEVRRIAVWRAVLSWQVEQQGDEVWYLWDRAALMVNVYELIAKLKINLQQYGKVKTLGMANTIGIPEEKREGYEESLLTYVGFTLQIEDDAEDAFMEAIYGFHDGYGLRLSEEVGIDAGRSYISCGVASFGSKGEMFRAIQSQLRLPVNG